jgi:hypothetical protein
MAQQEWTLAELADSALTLTVDENGYNKWGSTHAPRDVAVMLRAVAEQIDLEEARAIAKRLPKISTSDLDYAVEVLAESGDGDDDDALVELLTDERERREDDEPHDDTPSLDLPTYGA